MDSNSSSFTESFAKILYGGINPNIPGHGGEVCAKYLDRKLMVLDTAIGKLWTQLIVTTKPSWVMN